MLQPNTLATAFVDSLPRSATLCIIKNSLSLKPVAPLIANLESRRLFTSASPTVFNFSDLIALFIDFASDSAVLGTPFDALTILGSAFASKSGLTL